MSGARISPENRRSSSFNERERRKTGYLPDRPLVSKIQFVIPNFLKGGKGINGHDINNDLEFEEVAKREISVEMHNPLTPIMRVKWGGGRIYGGGTSVEAIRRAKRKNRRSRKPYEF